MNISLNSSFVYSSMVMKLGAGAAAKVGGAAAFTLALTPAGWVVVAAIAASAAYFAVTEIDENGGSWYDGIIGWLG